MQMNKRSTPKVLNKGNGIDLIQNKILFLRGKKVMLDRDLAELYGVETKYLNRQVKRNIKRFPEEFMFQLTIEEKNELVTNWHRFDSLKHSTSLPFAFTEYGAVMLATVLNSNRAVESSILVVKAFIRLREIVSTYKELAEKLKELELKLETHDEQITAIFEAINQLLAPPETPKKKIGFTVEEKRIKYSGNKKLKS
jgi:phage regulator Rha-like protein